MAIIRWTLNDDYCTKHKNNQKLSLTNIEIVIGKIYMIEKDLF